MSLTIPPLPPFQPQWPDFQVWWQLAKTEIESAQNDLAAQVVAIAAAQAAAAAAAAAASTAQTAATTAQSTADTVNRNDSISTSWTSPGQILSAVDAGSNATITIAAHTRHYTDATTASVSGGSLTARAYSTLFYIYYDQTSRAGGAVTYHSTTDPNVALANAAAGRHYCGSITTPASGGAATDGGVAPPSGGGDTNTGSRLIP